jgi:hypothetical protein
MVLHRKQICYIQSRRFDRFDRISHVVSIAKYTNVNNCYDRYFYHDAVGIIEIRYSLGEV